MRLEGEGEAYLVHRISYRYWKGPIGEGNVVMHVCDNPGCVNPGHLVAGSCGVNMWDKIVKGRQGGCVEVVRVCPF